MNMGNHGHEKMRAKANWASKSGVLGKVLVPGITIIGVGTVWNQVRIPWLGLLFLEVAFSEEHRIFLLREDFYKSVHNRLFTWPWVSSRLQEIEWNNMEQFDKCSNVVWLFWSEVSLASRHRGNTYLTSLPFGQRSSRWTCNSVKVEINFTSSAKLHFPSAQLILQQTHLASVYRG